jgi:hypothetical protein
MYSVAVDARTKNQQSIGRDVELAAGLAPCCPPAASNLRPKQSPCSDIET